MLNQNDKIVSNPEFAEQEFGKWKDQFPDVYEKMMEAAKNTQFEVKSVNGNSLTIRRIVDNNEFNVTQEEAAQMFIKVEETDAKQ